MHSVSSVVNLVLQNKNPSAREGPLQDEGLRYVFALAGIWSFLAGLLTFLAALLLTALLFLTPALIIRRVALLTTLLLTHTTLLTISFHVCLHFRTALGWVQRKRSRLL